MSKLIKQILALTMAAALLFAFGACGNNKAETTTEPITEATEDVFAESTTIEETSAIEETSTEAPVSETEASTTAGAIIATSAATTTTKASDTQATTTAAPADKKPATKAEIIAYVNTAMQKLRADKPGYTFQERMQIDDKKVSSSKGWINSVAPPIIKMAKGAWGNYKSTTTAKGASHAEVMPKADLQSAWVKNASLTESGSNYKISIQLVSENVPTLPTSQSSTTHGKVTHVFTKSEIADGAGDMGVDISQFGVNYSGAIIEITLNKDTGKLSKITVLSPAMADMVAKVPVFGALDAKIPLTQDIIFTF